MKKFETIKVTFTAYISVRSSQNINVLRDQLSEKLTDKLEMYCTDNAFGLTEPVTILEIQE
jgi:hypothetical protein